MPTSCTGLVPTCRSSFLFSLVLLFSLRVQSDDRDLENFGLAPFEVAQLGNLCPQDAQEAKALVPSLAMPDREIDNSQLTELLEQLNSHTQQYGQ